MSEIKSERGEEPSNAKRGRFDLLNEEGGDEYELELHHTGNVDEFETPAETQNGGGNPKGYDYHWSSDDDDENVRVQIQNRDSKNSMKRPFEANFEKETDPSVIARRSKQLEYGKNTPEYFNYSQAVPKPTRETSHPRTPNKYRKYSRRAWDGMVKQWRINLHVWSDYPISAQQQLAALNGSDGEKLNESFTSEASGSTSTTSSVAAAFSAELGFLNKCGGSGSESENEANTSRLLCDLNSTVVEKKVTRQDQIKNEAKAEKSLLSTSWADEVDEYYESKSGDKSNAAS